MKPLDCCNKCNGLNERGDFRNKLRCTFCEQYTKEFTQIVYNQLKDKRGCSTCIHCEHVVTYPAFVTAEECICNAGLKCDTVLFSVKNCPKWVGESEDE